MCVWWDVKPYSINQSIIVVRYLGHSKNLCLLTYLQEWIKRRRMPLTQSVGLHTRRRVDGVAKQAVTRHLVTDDTCNRWTCVRSPHKHIHTNSPVKLSLQELQLPLAGNCRFLLTTSFPRMLINRLLRNLAHKLCMVIFLANVNSSSCSLYVVVRPSVCLSVCRLSVCNVRAPYSGDWNFPNFFFAIWYAGHQILLTSR